MAVDRIHKIMAGAGVASRRACEKLIQEGRVTVNGRRAKIGMAVDQNKVIIAVDGKAIGKARDTVRRYVMVNKPRGYVTTMNDEMDRKCVADFVKKYDERLYPVGRLDKNSEGLLLFTNDGDLARDLMHPSTHIVKVYRVTVTPDISDNQLAQLAGGVVIDEGYRTAPAMVRVVTKTAGRVVLEISITEGKNRQIRKMCEAIGLNVSRLKRLSIGPLRLGMLQPGKTRELKAEEVRAIKTAVKQKKSKGNKKW